MTGADTGALPGTRREDSLFTNVAAQAAAPLLGYVLSFVAAPIVVAGLGVRMFGVWALTGALAQYAGLLDLGIGRSMSRFVAAHGSDRRACGEYMMIGAVSVALLLSVLVGLAVLLAPLVARSLGVPEPTMRVAMVCSGVLLASGTASVVVAAYPVGMRRMVAPNVGVAAGCVINFCASVGAIAAGAGLAGYAIANAAAGVVSLAAVTIIVLKVEGPIPFALPSRARTRDFVRFGAKLQLAWAMELVNYQSDKVVIAFSLGPAAAGSYELANRVAAAVRQLGLYPSTALLPTLTARFVESGVDELRRVYEHFTQRIAALAFPGLVLAAALSPVLFGAWLGRVPPRATIVLPALVVPYLATASSDLTKVVASATGNPSLVARIAVGIAALNIVLTASLAPIFGLWGVLVGTVVAVTAGALLQVLMVRERFGLPSGAYARAVGPSLALCLALAVPVALLSYSGLVHGRAAEAAAVLAMSSAYLAAYILLSLRAGRLPSRIVRGRPSLARFAVPS